MKRDNDYIRELLIAYEEREDWLLETPGSTGDDYETKETYHVLLMMDDGLLVEVGSGTMRLTSQGHDLLDAIRSETIWRKTKEGAKAVGGVTIGVLKEIAISYLRKEVSYKLGINLG